MKILRRIIGDPISLLIFICLSFTLMPVSAQFVSDGRGKLINISTRAEVRIGDNVLIAGFIITGGNKRVLIRADGQSLSTAGLGGFLQNPNLSLYSGSAVIVSNDNWRDSVDLVSIQNSGFAPAFNTEAAIVRTLAPGAYTAIVSGVSNTTGIALVSVFDLDPLASASRLANISSRAYSSTGGDTQVIAGFIIQGGSRKLLMRGAGPSLVGQGVGGALVDPSLTLYSGSTILQSNDDWTNASNSQAIAVVAGSGTAGKESIIFTELGAGAYTIIMRGQGTDGIGLVSVDERPQTDNLGPNSVAKSITSLYGRLSLTYGFSSGSVSQYFDSVSFGSNNLTSAGNLRNFLETSPSRSIQCGYLGSGTPEYYCVAFYASGSSDNWMFNLLPGNVVSGTYNFCLSTQTASACTNENLASPSGRVSGSVVRVSGQGTGPQATATNVDPAANLEGKEAMRAAQVNSARRLPQMQNSAELERRRAAMQNLLELGR